MKKKIAAVCITPILLSSTPILLSIALILLSADASAKEDYEEPEIIRCTCYCEHGRTAIGSKTDYGIISGKKEWLGCVAELHRINEDGSIGQLIGFFEFKDTGAGMDSNGDGIGDTIKNGKSVDVWVDTLEEAYMWRDAYGDYVYMKIIKGKG